MASQMMTERSRDGGLFEIQAVKVMRGLRTALLSVIEALPVSITRAADLERALGLSTTLAWQVHRIAMCPNPLEVGPDVPGAGAMNRVLKAARSKGVSGECIQRATEATQEFERFVQEHAGDRATFATMINSLAGHASDVIDVKTRKKSFQLNSQVWGVQAKTSLVCELYHPGKTPSVMDVVTISGSRDIRRLRNRSPLRLSAHEICSDESSPDNASPTAPTGPRLLRDFCTRPCPKLVNRLEDGRTATYLRETPLGNAGAQTLYITDTYRDVEWNTSYEPTPSLTHFVSICKPAEVVVLDSMVHADMFGSLQPDVRVSGALHRLGSSDPHVFDATERLSVAAEVHNLGVGLAVLPTPHVPRYAELVKAVCQPLGWDPNKFEVFRCVVEYPVLSSVISMHFNLPEKGNW